jgi:hypothetical protein
LLSTGLKYRVWTNPGEAWVLAVAGNRTLKEQKSEKVRVLESLFERNHWLPEKEILSLYTVQILYMINHYEPKSTQSSRESMIPLPSHTQQVSSDGAVGTSFRRPDFLTATALATAVITASI